MKYENLDDDIKHKYYENYENAMMKYLILNTVIDK